MTDQEADKVVDVGVTRARGMAADRQREHV